MIKIVQQFPLRMQSVAKLQRADPLGDNESTAKATDEKAYKEDTSAMQPGRHNQQELLEIVIGSRNVHKIREFRDIFKSLNIKADFLSLLNFPDYVPPEEMGRTLQENAILKAEHAAKTLGRWVIADDSGLFAPALGGLPGVRSHRYASDSPSDLENNQKLLSEMEGMEDIKRSAYFECCLALATPDGLKKHVTASCEGYIAPQAKGRNGFGYDVLFIKNEYDKTFAELDESIKNRISHRRKACEKMLPTLESAVTTAL